MQTSDEIIKAIKDLTKSTKDAQAVNELLKIVPEERIFELAELLVDFTQKNDCLLEFISQVVALEVSQTKQEMVLFREDCFAVKCINRILFSDLGKKYLTKLVSPIIKAVLSVKETIDISPELLKNDPKAFAKNIDLTVSYLDQFLTLFNKSPQFCPILFREIFSIIQQHVDSKFGTNNSPYVLDFIFFKFICPAIISPAKYQLVQDENEVGISAQRSLINISKVLNNLAHNITEKFEDDKEYEKLLVFIKTNHSVLISSLNRLVDSADIEKTKQILTASFSDTIFSPEELAETEEHLRLFLDAIFKSRSPAQSFSLSEQADLKDRKCAELLRKVESIDWKKKQTLKKSTLYQGKVSDTNLICVLVESTFGVPLKTLFDFLCNVDNVLLFHGNYVIKDLVSIIKQEENYKAYTIGYKFPFPLSSRINAFSQWECMQSDKKAMVVLDQLNDTNYGTKKGYIRGQLYTSGWILEAESDKVTKLKYIVHGHPKGSLPIWLVNAMTGSSIVSTEEVRNIVEKKQ